MLATLLVPSIKNTRLASIRAVCAHNQAQIYKAEVAYTVKNNQQITPTLIFDTGVRLTFDKMLADYMGYYLTEAQKISTDALQNNEVANPELIKKMWTCPNDITARVNTSVIPRSYAGVGRDSSDTTITINPERFGPMQKNYSWKMPQILKPSETLIFSERHDTNTYAGHPTRAALLRAGLMQQGITEQAKQPHGRYLNFNFTYVDGHTASLHLMTTTTTMATSGHWSIDTED